MSSAKAATTLYRNGDRTRAVVVGKNDATRAYRRDLADAEFPPRARAAVLLSIRAGHTVTEAAKAFHLSPQAVHGRARWDTDFAAELDDALEEGSRPRQGPHCGTPGGWRHHRCFCRRCRAAHNAEVKRYRDR